MVTNEGDDFVNKTRAPPPSLTTSMCTEFSSRINQDTAPVIKTSNLLTCFEYSKRNGKCNSHNHGIIVLTMVAMMVHGC